MTERPDLDYLRRHYGATPVIALCDAYEQLEAERGRTDEWMAERKLMYNTCDKLRAQADALAGALRAAAGWHEAECPNREGFCKDCGPWEQTLRAYEVSR